LSNITFNLPTQIREEPENAGLVADDFFEMLY